MRSMSPLLSALLQLYDMIMNSDIVTLSHCHIAPSGKETRKVENNNLADAWLQNFLFESQEKFYKI